MVILSNGSKDLDEGADDTLAELSDSAMSFRRRMRQELEQGLTASLPKRMGRLEVKLRAVMEGKEVPNWPPLRTKSYPSTTQNGAVAEVPSATKNGAVTPTPSDPPRRLAPSTSQKSFKDPEDAHPNVNIETRIDEYIEDLSEDLRDDIKKLAKMARECDIQVNPGMSYEEFKEKMTKSKQADTWRMVRERNRVQAFDVFVKKTRAINIEALKTTLQNLKQEMSKREGQARELQGQVSLIQENLEERKAESKIVVADLEALESASTPGRILEVQRQILDRRQTRLDCMQNRLKSTEAQAVRLESMARRQRAFLLQDALINSAGGSMVLQLHPAGSLFLEEEPLPQLSEEDAKAAWDVGSACCNPYVTDSWPIHPNALAQRAPEEPALDPWSEEESDADASEEEPDEDSPTAGRFAFRDSPFGGSSQGFRESPF